MFTGAHALCAGRLVKLTPNEGRPSSVSQGHFLAFLTFHARPTGIEL
jgi:hypothetical protein